MIPQDIIQRVVRAHNNAVRAALSIIDTKPGTKTALKCVEIYERAEHRFESAMAALIDDASKR